MPPRQFNHAEFVSALNTNFQLPMGDASPIDLELVEVTELRSLPKQEMYSIVFRGPRDVMLSQRTYRLEHAQLGTLDLFLVPIGVDEQGYSYEAVFNHLKKATA
jgi:hypothetical protein